MHCTRILHSSSPQSVTGVWTWVKKKKTQFRKKRRTILVTFLLLHLSIRSQKKWKGFFQGILEKTLKYTSVIFHFDVAWRSALCCETSGSEKIEVKMFGSVLPCRDCLSEKLKNRKLGKMEIFVLRKKGMKTKKRMKEEDTETGNCRSPTWKVFFFF